MNPILAENLREFERRLMSHPDFKVLQDLWRELGIPEAIKFDGTYPNQRQVAGAREGAGY